MFTKTILSRALFAISMTALLLAGCSSGESGSGTPPPAPPDASTPSGGPEDSDPIVLPPPPAPPEETAGGGSGESGPTCIRDLAYWTAAPVWPAETLDIGGRVYTEAEMREIVAL